MAYIDSFTKEVLVAHKAGKPDEVSILRLLISQLKNKEIEKRGSGNDEPLTEAEGMDVLVKEAKKRKEAIDLYTKGDRADLAAQEAKELELIYRFIPRELSREEVEKEIDALLAEEPSREFSVLMKKGMERMKGRADGKVVSEIIKAKS